MPFAKGVSAKSHDFDDKGNETQTDYRRMMEIVLDAGYRGYVGIEYEGEQAVRGRGHPGDEEAAREYPLGLSRVWRRRGVQVYRTTR